MFQKELFVNRPSRRLLLLVFLVLATFISSLCSVYIQPLSVTVTLESLFLLLTGYYFGPCIGALNGAVVDLVTFPFSGYEYSFLFTLQPALIGFIGGLSKFLMKLNIDKLKQTLAYTSLLFTALYGALIPSLLPILIIYPVISCFFILLLGRQWREKKIIIILIIFSLSMYISSFFIGVIGSMLLNRHLSYLLFFKVRIYKELFKLLTLVPILFYCVYKIK